MVKSQLVESGNDDTDRTAEGWHRGQDPQLRLRTHRLRSTAAHLAPRVLVSTAFSCRRSPALETAALDVMQLGVV